ncbi:hypothetical protein FQA39_LY14996, partial [Lamprigera yunnana]
HQLFIKKHSVRKQTDDKPPDQTLFVLNVPPYITEKCLRRAFLSAGPIDNVVFQSKPSPKDCKEIHLCGFKVAYIVFKDSSSLCQALTLSSVYAKPTIVTGVKKWMKQYNQQVVDQEQLDKEINNFVFKYDKQVERQKSLGTNQNKGGWTVVTSKGKNKGLSRKESVKDKIKKKIAKQDKRKYLTDFYVFQKRESKMNHLVQMRKKYEEDKKKVAAMKQARKFKPY